MTQVVKRCRNLAVSVIRWHAPHINLLGVCAIVYQEKLLIVVNWLCKEVVFCLLLVKKLPEITEPPSNFFHELYLGFKLTKTFFEV